MELLKEKKRKRGRENKELKQKKRKGAERKENKRKNAVVCNLTCGVNCPPHVDVLVEARYLWTGGGTT